MQQIATNPPLLGLDSARVWDTESAYAHLKAGGLAETKRTAERRLIALDLLPPELGEEDLLDEYDRPPTRLVLDWTIAQARRRRDRVLFVQLRPLPTGQPCLHANDARGARLWVPLPTADAPAVQHALTCLQQHVGKSISVLPHGALTAMLRHAPPLDGIALCLEAYRPAHAPDRPPRPAERRPPPRSPHLEQLEAESIHIIREAVAEARNPVMLHSLGKDSCVLLHLARKAFHPTPPPFPLLHIDTRWGFQELYPFRDLVARTAGMDLLIHSNPDATTKNINPFDHGPALHTATALTEALTQALHTYNFDMALTGARRDKDILHSSNRVFTRGSEHRTPADKQGPELWHLYNTGRNSDERILAAPLSNWTELDIWHYIYQEDIALAPLYFARLRPVVERPGMILMVDDDRCRLHPGEEIRMRKVRFPSLGCYPLTGAVSSEAETVADILLELLAPLEPALSRTQTAPTAPPSPKRGSPEISRKPDRPTASSPAAPPSDR